MPGHLTGQPHKSEPPRGVRRATERSGKL